MRLLLLRHAEAEPAVTSDAERLLTPRGREQAALAGAYCRQQGLRPDLVLTSPYRRTVQTGQIVAAAFRDVPAQAEQFLASGMEPADGIEGLRSYRDFACVLVVGHQPDLSLLAAALLGVSDPESFPFQLATLAGLRVSQLAPGSASLELFAPLSLMHSGL